MNQYRDKERACSSDSDDDDDEGPSRVFRMKEKPKTVSIANNLMEYDIQTEAPVINRTQKRKVNNIWASVAQEQAINDNMGQFKMYKIEDRLGYDRGCERYDFTRRALDNRPPSESESDDEINLDYGVSDIENEFDPLEEIASGKKPSKKTDPNVKILEKLEDAEKIAREVAKKLNEPKTDLITRSVQVLGRSKVFDLLHQTEDIEENGGLMILNGSRRRTPGGVFLYILRKDKHLTRKMSSFIFAEDRAKHQKMRKSHMRMLQKRQLKKSQPKKVKMETDACEPKASEIMEDSEPEASLFELEDKIPEHSQTPVALEDKETTTCANATDDVDLEEGEIA